MIERGLRHAYAVISNDEFAQRALDAFKAELVARGGQLEGSTTFSASTPLGGLDLTAATSDTGVFISMRPAQARALVPQLRATGIRLPVIATSHVYEGVDDATSNRDLDDVEFSDAPWLFDAQPGLPLTPHRGTAACGTWSERTAVCIRHGCVEPGADLDWLRQIQAATCLAPRASSPPTSLGGFVAY